MINLTRITPALITAAATGLVVGSAVTLLIVFGVESTKDIPSAEKEPLYWVAPMDPNYRRNEPGQSPMGMDLIPVYEDGNTASDTGPGTVRISPDVVNNIGVRTSHVEQRPLQSEIVTVGYVQYDQDKLIHIHPRVSGWVDKLFVKATGERVTKDTPLYALYSPELVNAQEELVLALNRKNSRLIQAAEDRLRALQIAEEFIDKLKRSLNIQQTITFYSPQDGVVDNLAIREGFYVQPGTTMFSIGALDQVWVEAEIFERQASLVNKGDPVTMTLDYLPGKIWSGQVDYIYPTLDSKTRTARLRLRFANPEEALKPNMFAQVTVHSKTENELLAIPQEALIRTGTQERVVLALGEGRFKSIAVTTGRKSQSFVEILSGLKAGEKVVTSAQFLLDSESSKTSDFKRMDHYGSGRGDGKEVTGDGKEVTGDGKEVTGDGKEVTGDGKEADESGGKQKVMDHSAMNHGQMDHEEMDHSTMDHGQMNHEEMDHSTMDHSETNNDEMDHSEHQQHTMGQE